MLSHASICRLARQSAQANMYGVEVSDRILRYGMPVGCQLEHFPRLSRCMDVLRTRVQEQSASSIATGTVVRADTLSGSSGRFARSWHAPVGGLYLALIWADTFLPPFSRLLPFAVGIACCETIRSCGLQAHLKWVNDVHVDGEKLAGILSEIVMGNDGERFQLIGIGVNVNITAFPDELHKKATSMQVRTGSSFDLDELFLLLLARLQWNFGLLCYAEELDLAGEDEGKCRQNVLLQRWRELSDTPGQAVVYGYDVQKKPLYSAKVLTVDDNGGLVMELGDGSRITEYSGEIMYRYPAGHASS